MGEGIGTYEKGKTCP